MSDILITGGAGNFGQMVSSMLKDKGHSLRIYDLPSCDFGFCTDWPKTKVFKGDILDGVSLKNALDGVDLVYHLAAILPPASEIDKERTFSVNVEGIKILVEACKEMTRIPNIIFTSSVHVYGDSSKAKRPIKVYNPPNPENLYAQSKVEAEQILFSSGISYVNLRISGVVVPAFLDPPDPWPFQKDQKIEMICLKDLSYTMEILAERDDVFGKTFILAGGESWQITGEEYVRRWGDIMGIPYEEMRFLNHPGWFNWYDTEESQYLLRYQNTTLDEFYKELEQAVQEALV